MFVLRFRHFYFAEILVWMNIDFYWMCNHPLRKLVYDFSPIHNVANYINRPSDLNHMYTTRITLDFPGGGSGKEPACQCRRHERHGFNPWVGKIPWRREWQPTPVFLLGESHGPRILAGYRPWGYKELDTTEATEQYSTKWLSSRAHIKPAWPWCSYICAWWVCVF